MVIKDLILLFKNAAYLPRMFVPSKTSDQAFRNQFSELNVVANAPSIAQLVREILMGNKKKRRFVDTLNDAEDSDGEDWFFLNGITTTPEIDALNRDAIASVFGRDVQSLYNPSCGIIADLAECVSERTFNNYAAITFLLLSRVQYSLHSGRKVVIIAHSQGGIILSNMLKQLRDTDQSYPNLEVYTFASAADEDIAIDGVHQEHYGNELDFVARMGLMNVETTGTFYMKSKTTGHFFNRDYLEHFKCAKYCNGTSRLFSYIKD